MMKFNKTVIYIIIAMFSLQTSGLSAYQNADKLAPSKNSTNIQKPFSEIAQTLSLVKSSIQWGINSNKAFKKVLYNAFVKGKQNKLASFDFFYGERCLIYRDTDSGAAAYYYFPIDNTEPYFERITIAGKDINDSFYSIIKNKADLVSENEIGKFKIELFQISDDVQKFISSCIKTVYKANYGIDSPALLKAKNMMKEKNITFPSDDISIMDILRRGLVSGNISISSFVNFLLGILRNTREIDVNNNISGLKGYRMSPTLKIKDWVQGTTSYDNLHIRRLNTELSHIENAIKDPAYKKCATDIIKYILASPFILDFTSHELIELDQEIIRIMAGNSDPDIGLKDRARETVLKNIDEINKLIADCKDPLGMAVKLSVLGNALDFGDADFRRKIKEEGIEEALSGELQNIKSASFWTRNDTSILKEKLVFPKKILYVLDNAGEDILDFVLISMLLRMGHKVVIAGRSTGANNDTNIWDLKKLFKDERILRLFKDKEGNSIIKWGDNLSLIGSGSRVVGMDLGRLSPELVSAWRWSDFVIFKGQGNYVNTHFVPMNKDVFYLLKVKWNVEVYYQYPKGAYAAEFVPAFVKQAMADNTKIIFNHTGWNTTLLEYNQTYINSYDLDAPNIEAIIRDSIYKYNILETAGIRLYQLKDPVINIKFLFSGASSERMGKKGSVSIFKITVKALNTEEHNFVLAADNHFLGESGAEFPALQDYEIQKALYQNGFSRIVSRPFGIRWIAHKVNGTDRIYPIALFEYNNGFTDCYPGYSGKAAKGLIFRFFGKFLDRDKNNTNQMTYHYIMQMILREYIRIFLKTGKCPSEIKMNEGDVMLNEKYYRDILSSFNKGKYPNFGAEDGLIKFTSIRGMKKGNVKDFYEFLKGHKEPPRLLNSRLLWELDERVFEEKDILKAFYYEFISAYNDPSIVEKEMVHLDPDWRLKTGIMKGKVSKELDKEAKKRLSGYAFEFLRWFLKTTKKSKKRHIAVLGLGAEPLFHLLKHICNVLDYSAFDVRPLYLNRNVLDQISDEDLLEYMRQNGLLNGDPITIIDTGVKGSIAKKLADVLRDNGFNNIDIECRLLYAEEDNQYRGMPIKGFNNSINEFLSPQDYNTKFWPEAYFIDKGIKRGKRLTGLQKYRDSYQPVFSYDSEDRCNLLKICRGIVKNKVLDIKRPLFYFKFKKKKGAVKSYKYRGMEDISLREKLYVWLDDVVNVVRKRRGKRVFSGIDSITVDYGFSTPHYDRAKNSIMIPVSAFSNKQLLISGIETGLNEVDLIRNGKESGSIAAIFDENGNVITDYIDARIETLNEGQYELVLRDSFKKHRWPFIKIRCEKEYIKPEMVRQLSVLFEKIGHKAKGYDYLKQIMDYLNSLVYLYVFDENVSDREINGIYIKTLYGFANEDFIAVYRGFLPYKVVFFHEIGEAYFRSKKYRIYLENSILKRKLDDSEWNRIYRGNAVVEDENGKEVIIPAHTYLRGIGKKAVSGARKPTPDETKLLAVGGKSLEDLLFGAKENNKISSFIKQEKKTAEIIDMLKDIDSIKDKNPALFLRIRELINILKKYNWIFSSDNDSVRFLKELFSVQSRSKFLSFFLKEYFMPNMKTRNEDKNLIDALKDFSEIIGDIKNRFPEFGRMNDRLEKTEQLLRAIFAIYNSNPQRGFEILLSRGRKDKKLLEEQGIKAKEINAIQKALGRFFKWIDKAELHYHLDGAVTPELALRILIMFPEIRKQFVEQFLLNEKEKQELKKDRIFNINKIFFEKIGGFKDNDNWKNWRLLENELRVLLLSNSIEDNDKAEWMLIRFFGSNNKYHRVCGRIKRFIEYRSETIGTTNITEFLGKFAFTSLIMYSNPEALRIVARDSTLQTYTEDGTSYIEEKIHNLVPSGWDLRTVIEKVLLGFEDAERITNGKIKTGLIMCIFKQPDIVLGNRMQSVSDNISGDTRRLDEVIRDIKQDVSAQLNTDYKDNAELIKRYTDMEFRELSNAVSELRRREIAANPNREKSEIDKAVKDKLLLLWETRKEGIEQIKHIIQIKRYLEINSPDLASMLTGIDTVGSEIDYITWVHSYGLRLAGNNGFRITDHAGESWPEGDIYQALDRIKGAIETGVVERIGHATALGIHPERLRDAVWSSGKLKGTPIYTLDDIRKIERIQKTLIKEIIQRGIVVETNPSSNFLLLPKYIPTYKAHPIRYFWKRFGSHLVVSSDDPTILHTIGLRGEFAKIWLTFPQFKFGELKKIIENGFQFGFIRNSRLSDKSGAIGKGIGLKFIGQTESKRLDNSQNKSIGDAIAIIKEKITAAYEKGFLSDVDRDTAYKVLESLERLYKQGKIYSFDAWIMSREDYLLAYAYNGCIAVSRDFFKPEYKEVFPEILFHEAYAALFGEADYESHRNIYQGIQRRIFGKDNKVKVLLRKYINHRYNLLFERIIDDVLQNKLGANIRNFFKSYPKIVKEMLIDINYTIRYLDSELDDFYEKESYLIGYEPRNPEEIVPEANRMKKAMNALMSIGKISRNKPPVSDYLDINEEDEMNKFTESILKSSQNIYLIFGSPGSGKTMFSEKIAGKLRKKGMEVKVLHLDDYITGSVLNDYNKTIHTSYNPDVIYIVEGFAYPDVLKQILSYIVNGIPDNFAAYQIALWAPFGECLKNIYLRGRRDNSYVLSNYTKKYDEWFLSTDFENTDLVAVNRQGITLIPLGWGNLIVPPHTMIEGWEKLWGDNNIKLSNGDKTLYIKQKGPYIKIGDVLYKIRGNGKFDIDITDILRNPYTRMGNNALADFLGDRAFSELMGSYNYEKDVPLIPAIDFSKIDFHIEDVNYGDFSENAKRFNRISKKNRRKAAEGVVYELIRYANSNKGEISPPALEIIKKVLDKFVKRDKNSFSVLSEAVLQLVNKAIERGNYAEFKQRLLDTVSLKIRMVFEQRSLFSEDGSLSTVMAELNSIYYKLKGIGIFDNKELKTLVAYDPLTAYANAEEFYRYVLLLERKNKLPDNIVILEIGVGNGRFASDFLDKFKSLDEQNGRHYYERIKYVMVDFSEGMIEGVEQKDYIIRHTKHLKFYCEDALSLPPDIGRDALLIRFNELYDDLPGSMLLYSDGKGGFYEETGRIDLDSNPVIYTEEGDLVSRRDFINFYWSGGIERMKKLNPDFIQELKIKRGRRLIDIKDLPYSDFIKKWAGSRKGLFSYNLGAVKVLKLLIKRLLRDKDGNIIGYIQSFDYGFANPDFIDKFEDKNKMSRVKGQPTVYVNFPLLQAAAEDFGLNSFLRTQAEYVRRTLNKNYMGPDIYNLFGAADDKIDWPKFDDLKDAGGIRNAVSEYFTKSEFDVRGFSVSFPWDALIGFLQSKGYLGFLHKQKREDFEFLIDDGILSFTQQSQPKNYMYIGKLAEYCKNNAGFYDGEKDAVKLIWEGIRRMFIKHLLASIDRRQQIWIDYDDFIQNPVITEIGFKEPAVRKFADSIANVLGSTSILHQYFYMSVNSPFDNSDNRYTVVLNEKVLKNKKINAAKITELLSDPKFIIGTIKAINRGKVYIDLGEHPIERVEVLQGERGSQKQTLRVEVHFRGLNEHIETFALKVAINKAARNGFAMGGISEIDALKKLSGIADVPRFGLYAELPDKNLYAYTEQWIEGPTGAGLISKNKLDRHTFKQIVKAWLSVIKAFNKKSNSGNYLGVMDMQAPNVKLQSFPFNTVKAYVVDVGKINYINPMQFIEEINRHYAKGNTELQTTLFDAIKNNLGMEFLLEALDRTKAYKPRAQQEYDKLAVLLRDYVRDEYTAGFAKKLSEELSNISETMFDALSTGKGFSVIKDMAEKVYKNRFLDTPKKIDAQYTDSTTESNLLLKKAYEAFLSHITNIKRMLEIIKDGGGQDIYAVLNLMDSAFLLKLIGSKKINAAGIENGVTGIKTEELYMLTHQKRQDHSYPASDVLDALDIQSDDVYINIGGGPGIINIAACLRGIKKSIYLDVSPANLKYINSLIALYPQIFANKEVRDRFLNSKNIKMWDTRYLESISKLKQGIPKGIVPNISVLPADAVDIPLDNDSVSAVSVLELFKWVRMQGGEGKVLRVMSEIFRILKPSGRLLLCPDMPRQKKYFKNMIQRLTTILGVKVSIESIQNGWLLIKLLSKPAPDNWPLYTLPLEAFKECDKKLSHEAEASALRIKEKDGSVSVYNEGGRQVFNMEIDTPFELLNRLFPFGEFFIPRNIPSYAGILTMLYSRINKYAEKCLAISKSGAKEKKGAIVYDFNSIFGIKNTDIVNGRIVAKIVDNAPAIRELIKGLSSEHINIAFMAKDMDKMVSVGGKQVLKKDIINAVLNAQFGKAAGEIGLVNNLNWIKGDFVYITSKDNVENLKERGIKFIRHRMGGFSPMETALAVRLLGLPYIYNSNGNITDDVLSIYSDLLLDFVADGFINGESAVSVMNEVKKNKYLILPKPAPVLQKLIQEIGNYAVYIQVSA